MLSRLKRVAKYVDPRRNTSEEEIVDVIRQSKEGRTLTPSVIPTKKSSKSLSTVRALMKQALIASAVKPSLFGLDNSNRDFSEKEDWGKNSFNSSFPAALCCYLKSKYLPAVYIRLDPAGIKRSEIGIAEVFGADPLDKEIFFAFEAQHLHFKNTLLDNCREQTW